ncbi:hypothetical protein [Parapedobacter composti]|uniref:hypothetical protein n=1 Tax=Parapedobacter composti TaxID=623281 RepID=UPI001113A159|nr:hypothetical protein [Parapedobacter composti]
MNCCLLTPNLRVKRKPLSAREEACLSEPIEKLEIAFCIDSFRQRVGAQKWIDHEAVEVSRLRPPALALWTSADNETYAEYDAVLTTETRVEWRHVYDANGQPLFDQPKRHLVMTVGGLHISPETPYVALTVREGNRWSTIPYSMIKAFSQSGEVPLTATVQARAPSVQYRGTLSERQWGTEAIPVKGNVAQANFKTYGRYAM